MSEEPRLQQKCLSFRHDNCCKLNVFFLNVFSVDELKGARVLADCNTTTHKSGHGRKKCESQMNVFYSPLMLDCRFLDKLAE